MSVLQEIVAHKRQELARLQAERYTPPAAPGAGGPVFYRAMHQATPDKPAFIFELKPQSPSEGQLAGEALSLEAVISAYGAVADAVSVLTDARYFGGSFTLLAQVVSNVAQPVLCKEFIIDPIQLQWARLAGASAALLIVRALDENALADLYQAALDAGLCPVVEVHDAAELARALHLPGLASRGVLLVNQRNLDTLTMHPEVIATLAPHIPVNLAWIAASGIGSRDNIENLMPTACRFLIGSSVMKQATAGNLLPFLHSLTGKYLS